MASLAPSRPAPTAYLAFLRENAPWLWAGFCVSLASTFGQTAFVAVFAGDLTARHGLGQGDWAAIYGLGTTVAAAAMLWTGALADRVPLPRLTAWTMAGLAASCLLIGYAPAAWLLPLAVVGLRLCGQGMLTHIAMVAMARWFVATRGRAIAVAAFGFAAGQATLPLAFTHALTVASATALWTLAAAVSFAAIWPLHRMLSRPRIPAGAEADAATEAPGRDGRHWTRAEVLRGGLFWMLMPAAMASPAFGTAFLFFQVHLPEAKGWSQTGFVALFPLFMGGSVAATFAAGALIDRVGASRLMPAALLPMALGFAILAWAPTLAWAVPAVACMATTQGIMSIAPVSLWAEQFGTRHIGAIKAASTAAMVLGTAAGPAAIGALIDRGATFPEQMPAIAALMVACSALAWWALRRSR
ncbi:MFS transporter [Jannaschia sp. LMIT008]|uniref:MFS transporter n=1 Tax=Jannaschia maritima TaxID=3032585 RepID=UPI0028126F07|nr:MFS transporter [Jannaschia sp. LMIT008]